MRASLSAAIAATVLANSSAFALDPSSGHSWQRATPPAAVAYFKLPFHGAPDNDRAVYGLAITAPTPRSYNSRPLFIADTPKLVDLRFNGAVPDTLRVSGQLAWTQDGTAASDRQYLFGSVIDLALGLAGTALAVYGVYAIVKKKCPAVSITTGACVQVGG